MSFLKRDKFPNDSRFYSVDEVTYLSDSYKVKALLVTPNDQDINHINIYLRGGKGNVGNVRLGRLLQFMTENSVVAGPYYRGSRGSEGMDELAGDDITDCINLIDILMEMYPSADVNIIGFSRGGIQAMNILRYRKVRSIWMINAVSSIYEMYDERQDLRQMMKRMIGHVEKDKEAYDEREAILHPLHLPDVFIIHGTSDQHVDIHQAEILMEYLDEQNHPYTFIPVEGAPHVLNPNQIQNLKREFRNYLLQ